MTERFAGTAAQIADQRHAQVIDRVTLVHLPEECIGLAKRRIGLVHGGVAGRRLAFTTPQCAGEPHLLLGIVDASLRMAGRA